MNCAVIVSRSLRCWASTAGSCESGWPARSSPFWVSSLILAVSGARKFFELCASKSVWRRFSSNVRSLRRSVNKSVDKERIPLGVSLRSRATAAADAAAAGVFVSASFAPFAAGTLRASSSTWESRLPDPNPLAEVPVANWSMLRSVSRRIWNNSSSPSVSEITACRVVRLRPLALSNCWRNPSNSCCSDFTFWSAWFAESMSR